MDKCHKSELLPARELTVKHLPAYPWAGVPFTSRFGAHFVLLREIMTTLSGFGLFSVVSGWEVGSPLPCGFHFPVPKSQGASWAGMGPPVSSRPRDSWYNARDKVRAPEIVVQVG